MITDTSPILICCRWNWSRLGSMASRPRCQNCRTTRRPASSQAYGLSAYDAAVLVAERASADYFEAVAKGRDGKLAANWVINELFGRLNKEGKSVETSPMSPAQIGGIVDLDRGWHHFRQNRQRCV